MIFQFSITKLNKIVFQLVNGVDPLLFFPHGVRPEHREVESGTMVERGLADLLDSALACGKATTERGSESRSATVFWHAPSSRWCTMTREWPRTQRERETSWR